MSAPPPAINRDEVKAHRASAGEVVFTRRRLAAAAGSVRIGASLYSVPAGARQMPVHVHGDEEEIFFILSGDGYSWQGGQACEVAPGDAIVHRPDREAHTMLAGEHGLELLAFGSGSDTSITWLPRAEVMWCGPRWVPLDAPHPFEAEARAGALARPAATSRPANVVALADVGPEALAGAQIRALGQAAGSVAAGLNHITLAPRLTGAPPHCHALEEELFFVLGGSGTLWLGGGEHPLRAGDVVARPPATGVCHAIRAGDAGLEYLVYGTRVAGDSVYYPDAGKIALRGLGVTIDAR
jgi:uncharacterized cupin superfamily protein